jgi:hypothetical protein
MDKPINTLYHYQPASEEAKRKSERKRKDAFAWKVGIFVMTIISCVGIYTIGQVSNNVG